MAIKNARSEREKMLARVAVLLKTGENKLQALVQVVGSKEDEAMQRVYAAFLRTGKESTAC